MVVEIPQFLQKEKDLIIFYGGSIAEGFSNNNSDIDLFVIAPSEKKFELKTNIGDKKTAAFIENNKRYDIEFYSDLDIENLLKTIMIMEKDQEDELVLLNFEQVQLIKDLLIGIPLCQKNEFNKIKDRFRQKENAITEGLSRLNMLNYNNCLEDLQGFIQTDEVRMAYLRSLDLLNLAIDLFLSSNGELNTKPKWRLKKLERLKNNKDVYTIYWSFISNGVNGDNNIRKNIDQILEFCSKILLEKQLGGLN